MPLAEAVRFDVLEGLIIAVDTKDHYTRRHSEDVARYAGFLAEQLGLDDQARSVVYRAGRLHDIGKIGIPDRILRKPAALTEQEYEIGQAARRPWRPASSATCPTSTRSVPASATTTSAGTGTGYLHRPRRRRDPGGRPHPRGLRRVLGDDDDPAVPQGPVRRRGADPPRGCLLARSSTSAWSSPS